MSIVILVTGLKITVTDNFVTRHIRQGDCNGVVRKGTLIPFRAELQNTLIDWPLFSNEGKRVINSFILNLHRSRTEIGNCIARLVRLKYHEELLCKHAMCLKLQLKWFSTYCKFVNTEVAVMRNIVWKNNDVHIGNCTCGRVKHITIGYRRIKDENNRNKSLFDTRQLE